MNNKTILITGGTGTLGQQIVKRLLQKDIKKVIIYSRDEYKQSEMERLVGDKRARFILGDIRDAEALGRACHDCDIIIHAAALKRVEKCEYNPFEAVKTNILGAKNIITAAIENNVERVIAISTDKAVNPINSYGLTKACGDNLFIDADAYAAGKTLFAVIRFGNFIGSRGSVLENWEKQNKNNESLDVTDREMTRFFIAPEEAVSRIFEVLELMRGGEIFYPKMPSVRIFELAQAISKNGNINIIGRGYGEKLHEDLVIPEYADRTYELDKFFITTKIYRGMGNKVSPNFSYKSNMNWDWINPEVIK